MPTNLDRVWLITGCSTGFGHCLAKQVLQRGYRLVATARKPESIQDLAGDRCLVLPLDVTQPEQVNAAVQQTLEKWGRIDVLVNNAGYGASGAVEEVSDEAIQRQYDVNVFGVLRMTRAVLPTMRKQRAGCILMLSSIVGICGFPGVGIYASTKHAVEGFGEALAAEVQPLGIKVVLIEPGPFRTDFFGRSMDMPENIIDDYAATSGERLARLRSLDGTAPGDPERAARAMIDLSEMDLPPLRMPMGRVAVDGIRDKLNRVLEEMNSTESASLATDFPE